MPWSEAHVRRLFWRAGFGATPAEAARWAQAGQDATIKNLLHGPAGLDGAAPKRFDPLNVWSDRALWWLDRMVRTRRPLEEKLTLFWHGLFVSSFLTVKNASLLYQQNELFRTHAAGNYKDLTQAV